MVRTRVARWARSADAGPSLILLREVELWRLSPGPATPSGSRPSAAASTLARFCRALKRAFKEGKNAFGYPQYLMP
jgi:hypothetical protein